MREESESIKNVRRVIMRGSMRESEGEYKYERDIKYEEERGRERGNMRGMSDVNECVSV